MAATSLKKMFDEARNNPEPYQDPAALVEDGEDTAGTENDPLSGKMRKGIIAALLKDAGVGKTLINVILALIPDEPEGGKSALAADAALMKRFPSAGRLR